MMDFPFPHLSKKEKFQYTFLNEVALKLYPHSKLDTIGMEYMRQFFKSLFDLDFREIHRNHLLGSRLKVGNTENGMMFEFCRDSIKVSIDQNNYSDFSTSMKPILTKLMEAYQLWFDSCQGIELKFVDVWPLAEKEMLNGPRIKELEDVVFSSEFRELSESEDENFNGLQCGDERFSLFMRYGYYISKNENQNSGVALETKCIMRQDSINTNEIVKIAEDMNDVLYDAFIWAVTPEIIKAMKNTTN